MFGVNLGDTKTLITHPSTTTHHRLSKNENKENKNPNGSGKNEFGNFGNYNFDTQMTPSPFNDRFGKVKKGINNLSI